MATQAPAPGYEFLNVPEVLKIKLRIWTKRLEYAREIRDAKRIAECKHAVRDLSAKIAAI